MLQKSRRTTIYDSIPHGVQFEGIVSGSLKAEIDLDSYRIVLLAAAREFQPRRLAAASDLGPDRGSKNVRVCSERLALRPLVTSAYI